MTGSAARSRSPARRAAVSDLFPVLAYDPDGKLYLLDDGSLGFAFRGTPVTATEGVTDGLNVLLNLEWPTQTLLQFTLWASPDLEAFLATYRRLRAGLTEPALRAHLAARTKFLGRGTRQPLEPVSGLRARDLTLIVSAILPLAGTAPGEREYAHATELRASAEHCLRSAGFAPIPLDPEGYLRVLGAILNGGDHAAWHDPTHPLYDPNLPIREQLVDSDTALQVDARGLWLGATRVTVLSPKRLPETVYAGSALRYLGDPLTGARGIREPLLITANVYFPQAERTRNRLEHSRQLVTHQAFGPLLKFVPKLAARKQAFDRLFQALDGGDRVLQMYLGVALFTPDEASAGAATTNLQACYRRAGLHMLPDGFIGLPLFLNLLPLGGDRRAIRPLRRYRTLASRHVIPLLPVFGDWKGTGTPTVVLLSRNGQVMGLSPFDSDSNYNAVIAAASGMGKSVLANELIEAMLSLGGRVWVIDVGRSYQKLTTALGGAFLAFNPDAGLCLNPFPLVGEYEEEADLLAGLLMAMAAPSGHLSDLQAAELKRLLRNVWDAHHQATTIDAVATALLGEADQRVRDLGRQLYPFTTAGEYGRFFNGSNTVDLDRPFVVLELEELKGRQHLQQVVLLLLVYQIQQVMYRRPHERDRPKLVLIDEAWELLAQGDVARFIESGYRRFRKYRGSAVVVTQSLNDLYASPSGIAIAENSAHLYLLGQLPETVTALERDGRLALGAAGYALLRTVHTEPGVYSEIFCRNPYGTGIGRLISFKAYASGLLKFVRSQAIFHIKNDLIFLAIPYTVKA